MKTTEFFHVAIAVLTIAFFERAPIAQAVTPTTRAVAMILRVIRVACRAAALAWPGAAWSRTARAPPRCGRSTRR